MSKTNFSSSTVPSQFRAKQSAADELATFRTIVSGLKKDPEKLRAIVVKAGIATPAGNLKKAYRD